MLPIHQPNNQVYSHWNIFTAGQYGTQRLKLTLEFFFLKLQTLPTPILGKVNFSWGKIKNKSHVPLEKGRKLGQVDILS
jgi:hypothetical protein